MDETTQPGRPMPPTIPPAAPQGAAPGPGKREPRSLPAGQGTAWWSEGWQVFMAAPGTWIGLIVVFILLMVAMAFVPVVGSLAESVLAPVFGGGIALGCHALAKGRPLTIGHLFEGFQGGRFMPLFIVGLIYLGAMFVLWIAVVAVVIWWSVRRLRRSSHTAPVAPAEPDATAGSGSGPAGTDAEAREPAGVS